MLELFDKESTSRGMGPVNLLSAKDNSVRPLDGARFGNVPVSIFPSSESVANFGNVIMDEGSVPVKAHSSTPRMVRASATSTSGRLP